jgi:hypothetical protein
VTVSETLSCNHRLTDRSEIWLAVRSPFSSLQNAIFLFCMFSTVLHKRWGELVKRLLTFRIVAAHHSTYCAQECFLDIFTSLCRRQYIICSTLTRPGSNVSIGDLSIVLQVPCASNDDLNTPTKRQRLPVNRKSKKEARGTTLDARDEGVFTECTIGTSPLPLILLIS